MPGISAVIITLNEESNLIKCLESLKTVIDELIVIDAGSSDETILICKANGAKVIHREWQGYASAKNFGNQQATQPYILSIDADEVLSPELIKSIVAIKSNLSGAYSFNRLNNYCGRWIKRAGWYPDTKVRLFPKDQAQWLGDFVHEELILQPGVQTQQIQGDLLHFSIKSREDHLQRIEKYASLSAQKMYEQGKKPGWLKKTFSPTARFLNMYLLKLGFLEDPEGLQLCQLSARAARLRYKKLSELYRNK